MPLDIRWFRQQADDVRNSELRRGRDPEHVDRVIALDEVWRKSTFKLDNARRNLKLLQDRITTKKKDSRGSDPCDAEMTEKTTLEGALEQARIEASSSAGARDAAVKLVGNVLHPSVPSEDTVLHHWGMQQPWRGKFPHYEAMRKLGLFEQERGCKVAGHRGYFLRGAGVLLNLALVQYGVAFLVKRGFTPMQPPYFMRKEVMAESAELADFDDQLYKVSESAESTHYLIATSEQPMTAFHRKEWLDANNLPLKYAGVSTCFRKEAGSHGRDTLGLFRLHQFEKVEQFCVTTPEESVNMHAEMLNTSESFYQSLELPYRVVQIGASDLNLAATRKYDIEAFFPADGGSYRELVSCSNCTDYQSLALEVRIQDTARRYAHMLNSTLVATERTMCCIVEQHQTPDGVSVPLALRPYMHGMDFLAWKHK